MMPPLLSRSCGSEWWIGRTWAFARRSIFVLAMRQHSVLIRIGLENLAVRRLLPGNYTMLVTVAGKVVYRKHLKIGHTQEARTETVRLRTVTVEDKTHICRFGNGGSSPERR